MQKPIVDLSKIWLAPRPSKNYIFHLLHHHIQSANPARSLDAGVGELRNFWMFPGKYVGISHNRPAYFRGLERLTTPHPIVDITVPHVTDSARYPNVVLMKLESDFSFLGTFDLVVCTQTIFYVENRVDALKRLSDRVKRGGTLIVDDHIASAESFRAAITDDYEDVEIVYHGFGECDDLFAPMPELREITPAPKFVELTYREMTAPNLPDNHTSFYLIARNKKKDAAPPNPAPELLDDRGLLIVKKDVPYLKMDDDAPNAVEVPFSKPVKRAKITAPVLHIGPPKTASTTIQEFIIPHLGRPYLIKPAWGKGLTRFNKYETPTLEHNVIVSDEEFGRFLYNAPPVVAERLSAIAPEAAVIFVRRAAKDLFRSFYRQTLVNNLAQAEMLVKFNMSLTPMTPDVYFDLALATYRERGTGVLAMMDHARLREAFGAHFEVNVLEYDQLRNDPRGFVAAFAGICNCPLPQIDLGSLNLSSAEKIDTAIADVSIPMDPELLDLYRRYYVDYRLAPGRERYLVTTYG